MSGMNEQAELRRALGRLARGVPREATPAAQQRVLAAFRAQRRRSRPVWAYWGGSAAVCLALGFGWLWLHHSPQRFQTRPNHTPTSITENYNKGIAGFMALPYGQSDVPLEQAVIVRVKLGPSELEMMGVPVISMKADGKISADVLVGQDGVARAVRFVE